VGVYVYVHVCVYVEMEAADTRMNNELTADYRTLTGKYKELQAKFRHFEVADTGKYDEVWTMHEEEVKDKIDQLLKADKLITEQQLGWSWRPPDMQALQGVLGRHGSLGIPGNPIHVCVYMYIYMFAHVIFVEFICKFV